MITVHHHGGTMELPADTLVFLRNEATTLRLLQPLELGTVYILGNAVRIWL